MALTINSEKEFERNHERYTLLKWAQQSFENFRVVPPATGIVHQVNLEYLGKVVWDEGEGTKGRSDEGTKSEADSSDTSSLRPSVPPSLFPDSLVGTDSHTTMINGLGIVGWGVGGIEAEAVMLGQPIYMLIPEVVGFKLTGKLPEGATATDLVLQVTQMLREHGVVGKFVEFFGPGLEHMPLANRATIANMAPEYGATMGFFPVDDRTLEYMRLTGRDEKLIDTVEQYCKAQGLWREDAREILYSSTLELDMGEVEPSLAGPKRPQDRIALSRMREQWRHDVEHTFNVEDTTTMVNNPVGGWVEEGGQPAGQIGNKPVDDIPDNTAPAVDPQRTNSAPRTADSRGGTTVMEEESATTDAAGDAGPLVEYDGHKFRLHHGAVVIAAITSCTNTSNPEVMIAAGLVARAARKRGLTRKPWVKTSLAPGSKVVTEYYDKAGLTEDLDALGFNLVGYGCTTCIGNSGPLPEPISQAIHKHGLVASAVLSGNRNFEGRISPDVKANYLASPPLVVAYALAGSVDLDLTTEPLGKGRDGKDVYLKDLWPTQEEIQRVIRESVTRGQFEEQYADVFAGSQEWQAIEVEASPLYPWAEDSMYVQEPPFFTRMPTDAPPIQSIEDARCLVKVGDSVTTDHISPAGSIKKDSPAGRFLQANGVPVSMFNSYGARRGNDRVMTRGTFANIRVKNQLAPGTEGGWTTHFGEAGAADVNPPAVDSEKYKDSKYAKHGQLMSIFDASVAYRSCLTSDPDLYAHADAERGSFRGASEASGTAPKPPQATPGGPPLVVLAGIDYGMGSSRDWAAKGTYLLGVRAVLAASYERIHRSNLVGMGVLPLQFADGQTHQSLGLDGTETYTFNLDNQLKPGQDVTVTATTTEGETKTFHAKCRIDTPVEVDYYRNGGILHTVLRAMAS